jgi:hypothetical protein
MIEKPKILALGPMARWLRVTTRWLRAEAEAGQIPHIKADKVLLFDPNVVEAVLIRRAADPEAAGKVRQRDVILPLLTDREVADLLALTPRQVLRLASRGEIPSILFPNNERRYDRGDVKRFIEASERGDAETQRQGREG